MLLSGVSFKSVKFKWAINIFLLVVFALLLSSCTTGGFSIGYKNNISVIIAGQGSIEVISSLEGDGADHPGAKKFNCTASDSPCNHEFLITPVEYTLIPTADAGSKFVGWTNEDGYCQGQTGTCELKTPEQEGNGYTKLGGFSKQRVFTATFEEVKSTDISGTWTGIATSGSAEYFYSWEINQSQENVTGVITIAQRDKSLLSSYEFAGTFKDDVLQFEGTKFINLADGAGWCMTKGTLNYKAVNGEDRFEGIWGPHAIQGGCPEGSGGGIKLAKPTSKSTTTELDISGTWTGIATSGPAEFFYSWDINQIKENVTGVITIGQRDKSLLSSYEFSGTFKDDVLSFEGTRFVNLADGATWCMTKGDLNYKSVNGEEKFEGTWGPHAIQGGCPEGSGGGVEITKE